MTPYLLLDALRLAWNAAPTAQDVLEECACWRGDEALTMQAMRLTQRYFCSDARGTGANATNSRSEAFLLDFGMAQLCGGTRTQPGSAGGVGLVGILAGVECVAGMGDCSAAQDMRAARRLVEIAEGLQARECGTVPLNAQALRAVADNGERVACGSAVGDILFGQDSRIRAETLAGAVDWLMRRRSRLPESWRPCVPAEPGQGDWAAAVAGGMNEEDAAWYWRESGEVRLPRMLADLLASFGVVPLADGEGEAAAALGAALQELAPAQAMRVMNTAFDTMLHITGGLPGASVAKAARWLERVGSLPPAAMVHCLSGLAEMYAPGCEHRTLLPGGLLLAGQPCLDDYPTRRHRGLAAANSLFEVVQRSVGGWEDETWHACETALAQAAQTVGEGLLRGAGGMYLQQQQGVARRAGEIAAMVHERRLVRENPASRHARRRA